VDSLQIFRAGAFLVAGVLSAGTSWRCYQGRGQAAARTEGMSWAGIATTFLVFSQISLARGLGWHEGWGEWLRAIAKQEGLYADRRVLQITASIAVAVLVVLMFVYALIWVRHHVKRYFLAMSFATLVAGFAAIRFISLHEIDAWNASMPNARLVVELIATSGASILASIRFLALAKMAALEPTDEDPRQEITTAQF